MPDTRKDFALKLMADDPNLSDADLEAALKVFDAHQQQMTTAPRSWLDTVKDLGIGAAKGVGSTVAGLGEMATNAGMIPGQARGAPFNPVFRNPVFTRAEEATTATNTPQRIGKVAEVVGELALPTGVAGKAAVEAIPSATRAGAVFQDVMKAAKNVPVDASKAGDVGLRIMQIAERGGGALPQPVRQFLGWITNPDKPQMTYDIARDFASGISRLSANEMQRLSPTVAREVAELRVTLNKAVAEAASKAGKGAEYARAMNEYAKAKKLTGMLDEVVKGAKKAAPFGLGLGAAGAAGGWLTKEIMSLLGGD